MIKFGAGLEIRVSASTLGCDACSPSIAFPAMVALRARKLRFIGTMCIPENREGIGDGARRSRLGPCFSWRSLRYNLWYWKKPLQPLKSFRGSHWALLRPSSLIGINMCFDCPKAFSFYQNLSHRCPQLNNLSPSHLEVGFVTLLSLLCVQASFAIFTGSLFLKEQRGARSREVGTSIRFCFSSLITQIKWKIQKAEECICHGWSLQNEGTSKKESGRSYLAFKPGGNEWYPSRDDRVWRPLTTTRFHAFIDQQAARGTNNEMKLSQGCEDFRHASLAIPIFWNLKAT